MGGTVHHVNGREYIETSSHSKGDILTDMLKAGRFDDFRTLSSSLAKQSMGHTMGGFGAGFWGGPAYGGKDGLNREHVFHNSPGQGFGHGFGHRPGHHGFGHGFGFRPQPSFYR